MTRLETQLETLKLFERFSEDQLRERPLAEKWSAHENLAHLGHYQETFIKRIERILTEDAPELERYRAEDHAGFTVWVELPTAEVLAKMKTLRLEMVNDLNALTPHDFEKIGVHPVYGRLSLTDWLEFFLIHEGHHFYIAILRAGQMRKLPLSPIPSPTTPK